MKGIIKLEKRYGLDVYVCMVVDKSTNRITDKSMFMSEQAARNWIARHTLWS
jgi:hypothetical protein